LRPIHNRTLLFAVFAVTSGLIIADAITWIDLDVSTIYSFPLLLAGATRSRRLLWMLAALLTIATFVVYAVQIPSGTFTLHETFFINRMLDVVTLLLIAWGLNIWMNSVDISEAQARLLKAQDAKIETAKISMRLVDVQEAERRALANELHDLVSQKLAALSINLNIVKGQLLPSQPARIDSPLENSLALVEEITVSIRDVMAELRPAVLDDFGLAPALHWYAEQFAKRTGVPTTVTEQGPTRRLVPAAEEALFRIAQEALANLAKYARAQKAMVTLEVTPHAASLTIADDGCGFDPAAGGPPTMGHGWGLMIMRERAVAVGAQLSIESASGRGTRPARSAGGATRYRGGGGSRERERGAASGAAAASGLGDHGSCDAGNERHRGDAADARCVSIDAGAGSIDAFDLGAHLSGAAGRGEGLSVEGLGRRRGGGRCACGARGPALPQPEDRRRRA
jgi:signal transduction histidine kinase